MESTSSINKAAYHLSKISIFQMDPGLVHSYAQLDCMLHGILGVTTWEPAIKLVEQLVHGGCPKKAVLSDIKDLLLKEQLAVAMKGGAGFAPPSWGPSPLATKVVQATATTASTGSSTSAHPQQASWLPPKAPTMGWGAKPLENKSIEFTQGPALQVQAGNILVKTPFSQPFINALKTLPIQDRKWDSAKKVWVVAVAHKNWVVNLLNQTFPGKVQELA